MIMSHQGRTWRGNGGAYSAVLTDVTREHRPAPKHSPARGPIPGETMQDYLEALRATPDGWRRLAVGEVTAKGDRQFDERTWAWQELTSDLTDLRGPVGPFYGWPVHAGATVVRKEGV